MSWNEAKDIVSQGAEYAPEVINAGQDALDYALQFLTLSELAALTIIFLYSLQLTARGRLIETIVKTLIGYIVYKAPVVEWFFGPLNMLEYIAVKVVIGLLAVALTEWVLFRRKKH